MEVLRWGYQIPFRWAPTLSRDPIPLPAYAPKSIRGKALEEEVQALLNKGAIELAPLPSTGFYSRLFVVMKDSGAWRPVIDLSTLNLRVQQTSFKMETLQSVLLSVRPGDWMVSLDLKDAYLQVPMHPDSRKFLRFMVGGKVYQFKVLCFGLSTAPQVFTRVMAPVSAILPGRLVASGFLTRAGSSCSEVSAPTLQTPWDCRQLGKVAVSSDSADDLSGSPSGFHCFQGFSCPEESREASLNRRRILVLRQTASVILAGVVRGAVLNDPTRSWGSPPHEVAPTGASASVGSGRMVSVDPRRSLLVARPRSISARRFSGAGVPSARGMVRRLGRGLGGSLRRSGRFRPLGSGGWRALDQCSGALGDRESSQVVCSTSRRCLSDSLRRQFDCSVISAEPRRDSLFTSELHRSEDSPLGGGSVGSDFPAVCYGETQCVGGRSFSPEPDLGRRVDAEAGGLHGSLQEVTGVNRPVCNITKSPMFTIFFSLPRSQCSGDGCTAPKLEWVAGICLSSLVSHSSSSEEAPVVLWGATDHRSSVLASEAMVSGSSGSGG